MKANFLYVPSDRMGYGRMGTRLAAALERQGVKLLAHPDVDGPCKVVSWNAIPGHGKGWYRGQYRSILTMWEATRLPEAFRENLNAFDLVMVPSEQNNVLFSEYHDNVRTLYLGFDKDDWHYRPRQPPDRQFRFLIGGNGERKGVDLVVKAYNRLWAKEGSWGDGPTPVVYFKCPNGRPGLQGGIDLPLVEDRMFIIGGRLEQDEECDLYGLAHCYLQPSRGEGFGLQPLQAIAQGLPTILTDAHGHASFSHLGFGIPAELRPAGYFMLGDAGDWWEPDLDTLCDLMRWVYEHYEQSCVFARGSAREAHAEFTWDHVAARWIGLHGDHLHDEYDGDWTWEEPDPLMFPIRVLREWAPNIAGTQYLFKPGSTYYVSGDVKRQAWEKHNLLDQESLLDPGGLTESQVANLGLRRADHEYCPSCQQRLNSQPTRADDLYETMA